MPESCPAIEERHYLSRSCIGQKCQLREISNQHLRVITGACLLTIYKKNQMPLKSFLLGGMRDATQAFVGEMTNGSYVF